MGEVAIDWESVWQGKDPACRVVRNAWTGEIEGVGVWDSRTWTYDVVRLTGPVQAKVREAFARSVAESIVDAMWSGSGMMQLPTSREGLLTLGETVLDPRSLGSKLVGAAAGVAALHAGFPPAVASAVGRLAENSSRSFFNPSPAKPTVRPKQCLEFAFSAATGSLIGSPGLHEVTADLAADAVDKLLGTEGRHVKSRSPEPPTRGVSGRLERLVERQRHEQERLERDLERQRLKQERHERRAPEIRGPEI
jgi:hypothetical protein